MGAIFLHRAWEGSVYGDPADPHVLLHQDFHPSVGVGRGGALT